MDITIVRTKEERRNVRPYLTDVPVKVNIWIRPELQKMQFDVLRKACPSVLFVQSDGGRNEKEWDAIRENRKLFDEEIDWDCTIHKIYADKNYGLYTMMKLRNEYLWSQVDRCIFLEDDLIPSVSFFSFCAEMLEKYKDDYRIGAICGMNHMGIYDKPSSDYFFSRRGSIWGTAQWRRTAENFTLDYRTDPYVMDGVCEIAKKHDAFCQSMRTYAKEETCCGHVPGSEFFLLLNIFAQNQLFIIPKKNMISCHGCGAGATHAPDSIKKMSKGIAQLYYMQTYELGEEICHPTYVFPDLVYEKKLMRIMAIGHPFVGFYRKAEGICRQILYGDGLKLIKKACKRLKRKKGIHTEK